MNKKDWTNILAWGGLVKMRAEEDGVPFEDDEEETMEKVRHKLKLSHNSAKTQKETSGKDG